MSFVNEAKISVALDVAGKRKDLSEALPTISHLTAENFLSFRKLELDFEPLSVLVGPNGAGKTNILKVFQFLGDVARNDLMPAIAGFGGFQHLIFRGAPRVEGRRSSVIKIAVRGVITKHASLRAPDEYSLSFWQRAYGKPERLLLQRSESIVIKRTPGRGRRITLSGTTAKFEPVGTGDRRALPGALSVQTSSTGLATLRKLGEAYDAEQVEEIAQVFEQLRLFEIDVERVRRPAKLRNIHTLRPDGANLAVFLHYLSIDHPIAFERVCDDVRFVLPAFEAFIFTPLGGSDEGYRIEVKERHLIGSTPLSRLSFGTIRSIALFAMLHDPDPPKLTCLEEIDHGLHPYALDLLVDRLREASKATQFILATHSPALVNRLSPSELIVIEQDHELGESRVAKPDAARVARLQAETGYDLGELWFSGLLGGTN